MKSTEDTRYSLRILLAESHEKTWPSLIKRDFNWDLLSSTRLLTLVGPRRAGKTFLCYQILRHLLDQGTPRHRLLYLNFEDERLYPMSGQELTLLLDVYEELFPWKSADPLYVVLDEIQNVPQWSRWARRVHEQHPKLHLILTGSSSKLLSTELATELRGRTLGFSVYPYSFSERLRAEGEDNAVSSLMLHGRGKNRMRRSFDQFLLKGGFPEPCLQENPQPVLQSYYQTMFMRDLVERYRINNVPLFEDFLKVAISRFGSLFSVSALHKELEARHGRVSKATLVQYTRYAREVFLLFELHRFDFKIRRQLLHPRKLYGVDVGLLNAIRFSSTEDRGRLLENAVYLELLRRPAELYFWRQEAECDFLIKEGKKVTQAIQVSWSVEKPETRERELRGLLEATTQFHLKEGLILTAGETADFKREHCRIRVRPFWYWAIGGQN
ncbi:MAG: hypothetical protein KCHDKBKB_01731 [Elusimicrobia bacterium]|nr:hypothetical protein [Elusimicrobiota bacterium]